MVTNTILEYINKQTHLKNFMSPVTTVADLFHLAASYLFDSSKQELIIFLHAPVTRNTEIMDLHKYHAFPLAVEEQDVIPVVGDKNIIAIGLDQLFL